MYPWFAMVFNAGHAERTSPSAGGQKACFWPVTGQALPVSVWSTGGCDSGRDMMKVIKLRRVRFVRNKSGGGTLYI